MYEEKWGLIFDIIYIIIYKRYYFSTNSCWLMSKLDQKIAFKITYMYVCMLSLTYYYKF